MSCTLFRFLRIYWIVVRKKAFPKYPLWIVFLIWLPFLLLGIVSEILGLAYFDYDPTLMACFGTTSFDTATVGVLVPYAAAYIVLLLSLSCPLSSLLFEALIPDLSISSLFILCGTSKKASTNITRIVSLSLLSLW